MNHTSLRRRLLAGAASLMIGAAGGLTIAGPAAATEESAVTPQAPSVEVLAQTCEQVEIKFSNPTEWLFVFDYRVDDEEALHEPVAPGVVMEQGPFKDEEFGPRYNLVEVDGREGVHEEVVTLNFEPGSGEHTVEWRLAEGAEQALFLDWDLLTVDCGKPPENEMPEEVDADFFPVVSCEFLVFFLNNTGEEAGISFQFTPNQDAVHGHGGDFLEFLDEFLAAEPGDVVEIPGDAGLDTEGEGVGEIGAGETAGPFGPFLVDGVPAHAHGFEAAPGLVVQVEVFIGEGEAAETVLDEEFAWDELIGDRECDEGQDGEGGEDGGEGGELPKTGISTGMIVAGAAALLVLGGGMFLLARRRRVTFTS